MANFDLVHTFHDNVGEVASGEAVTEDLIQLKERIELLENSATAALGVQQFQSGRTSLGTLPAGFTTAEITLGKAWTTEHISFVANGRGALNDAGFVVSGVDTSGLAHGIVVVNNNTEQVVNIDWISVGR